MPNDLTFTLTSNPTAVPLQNLTLSVTPSANFNAASYLYQWKLGGSNIANAVGSTYSFDAANSTGFSSYTCAVSGLSSNGTLIYSETTGAILVRVIPDSTIFSRHAPQGYNALNESGQERFQRIRNLGYC